MKERPILFSAPMVRALLAGTKTQTRRVVKPSMALELTERGGFAYTDTKGNRWMCGIGSDAAETMRNFTSGHCPYGQPGDRLWVREAFSPIYPQDPHYNGGRPIEYDYAATYRHGGRLGDLLGIKKKWKPSIHMPRDASRITLEVVAVRVERLQDISEADALAEGIVHAGDDNGFQLADTTHYGASPVESYCSLWESINGPESWDANPDVWVVEFQRVEGGAA